MNRISLNEQNLLGYGISDELASKASNNKLTLSKIRALSIEDMVSRFKMSAEEAAELKKCVVRKIIQSDVVLQLLSASNFTCNVCKGSKGHSFIIHHIIPYEKTQDNEYENLIVLCPSDHDIAHRGGLTLGLSEPQLRTMKSKWESEVIVANINKASQIFNSEALFGKSIADSEDTKTLRYLMNFINFTALSSQIVHLPKMFDVDFADVATYMETLYIDRPQGYPFSDVLLQEKYEDYFEKYRLLYRLLVGKTRGIDHFEEANFIGNRYFSKRHTKNFTYQENTIISNNIVDAVEKFEVSYRNLIAFLKANYSEVKLGDYNKY